MLCGESDGDEDDEDDDDPTLSKKAKKLLPCQSSSNLLSSSTSSSVASQKCPASSNINGHHQNLVADTSQEQMKGSKRKENRWKHGDEFGDKWAVLDRKEDEDLDNRSSEDLQMEKSSEAGEDLNKNSSLEECPLLPADVLEPSPCLSPGWGIRLPDSVQHEPLPPPLQTMENIEMWRPWETGKSRVGQLTPAKPSFSAPFLPSPPRRRVLRRTKKRKRSPGELVKRRQRHLSYQLNQTPPSSTSFPEPDQSTLESGNFEMDRNMCLFPPWNPFFPSSPESLLPTPSPPPFPSPLPRMSDNLAPQSPVFCDGCHRWGNLLTVTISQGRGP